MQTTQGKPQELERIEQMSLPEFGLDLALLDYYLFWSMS